MSGEDSFELEDIPKGQIKKQLESLLIESRINVEEEKSERGYVIFRPEETGIFTIPVREELPHGVLLVTSFEVEGRKGIGMAWARERIIENTLETAPVKVRGLTLSDDQIVVVGRNPFHPAALEKINQWRGRRMKPRSQIKTVKIKGGPLTSRAQLVIEMTGENGLRVENIGRNPVGLVDRTLSRDIGKQMKDILVQMATGRP